MDGCSRFLFAHQFDNALFDLCKREDPKAGINDTIWHTDRELLHSNGVLRSVDEAGKPMCIAFVLHAAHRE
jgi:hypothetical protein